MCSKCMYVCVRCYERSYNCLFVPTLYCCSDLFNILPPLVSSCPQDDCSFPFILVRRCVCEILYILRLGCFVIICIVCCILIDVVVTVRCYRVLLVCAIVFVFVSYCCIIMFFCYFFILLQFTHRCVRLHLLCSSDVHRIMFIV